MKKTIIILLATALIIGLGVGFYQFNKPHADIASQEAVVKLTAGDLFDEYEADEAAANAKYLGKIIEVNGTIFSIDEGSQNDFNILLMDQIEMFGVACNISAEDMSQDLKNGQSVTLKGECSGMLSDVVMIRCVIVNN